MALYTKIKGPVNYTVIGSPTIVDGVVSGFSSSDYLTLPNTLTGTNIANLEFFTKITIPALQSSNQYIISYRTGALNGIAFSNSGKVRWVIGRHTGGAVDEAINSSLQVNENDIVYIHAYCVGFIWYLRVSKDNINWTQDTVTYNPNLLDKLVSEFYIGNSNNGNRTFNGSIDLKETYIKINDVAWFGSSLSKVKVRTGLTKYTVVGSPTIENGIASGFSGSNYLKTTTVLPGNTTTNLEFGTKFKINSLSSTSTIVSSTTSTIPFHLAVNNSKFKLYPGLENTYKVGSFELSIDTDYYIKLSWNTTDGWKLQYSTDGINYTTDFENYKPDNSNPKENYIIIGRNYVSGGGEEFLGSIDLNETYIKINGGYFWRGSHQNINAWKIQQDNFSKYYTIVDGKLMWASPDIYLKSSTTAQNLNHYINTNYYPNNNTRVITSFENSTRNYGIRLFGEQHSPNMFRFGTTNGTGWLFAYGSQGTSSSTINFIHERVKVDFNKNVIKINDTVINTFTEQTFTSTQPFYLMNINQSTMRDAWDAPVYWCKIYDNDILVRHFVPVPKGLLIGNFVVPSNGMFDIVEQKFYGNSGTGEFTIGGIPQDYIIEGGKLIWCNPDIYLQSSGTQWIDTGISNIWDTLKFKTKFIITGNTITPSEHGICGAKYEVTTTQASVLFISSGNTISSWSGSGTTWSAGSTITQGSIYDVTLNFTESKGREFLINGTSYSSTTISNNSRNSNFNFALFSDGVDPVYTMVGKIFNFSLIKNNFLNRYFVPVPKGMLIGDKIAPSNCMFDMVTQTFFENQGTGDFIIGGISGDYINVGDNIVWTHENVYLQSSGTQYIDTNVKPTNLTKIKSKISLSATNKFVYGSRTSQSGYDIHDWNFGGGEVYPQFGHDDSSKNYSWNLNTIYEIENSQNGAYINDSLVKSYSTYTFNSTFNMYLFGLNNSNSLEWRTMSGKIYNFQIIENTKLIRYFLPVNTNTIIGNFTVPAPGMWDAVTKKFYPNKGAGAFTYGKDS